MMDQNEEQCFFEPCPESQAGKTLTRSGPKRIRSIIKASKEVHGDGRHENLELQLANDENAFIFCHRSCVSSYVSTEHLKRSSKHPSSIAASNDIPHAKRSRRSETPILFNFKKHCIFCGDECVMEKDPRHPSRWRRVVLCRTVDKVTAGEKTFKESILEVCGKRNDELSRQVTVRVLSALSDLHAADARYHKDCRDQFMPVRSVASAAKASGSQPSSDLEDAFLLTVSDIEAEKSKIWNSVKVFDLYVSHGGKECSRRSLVPKLCDYFGSDFLVLSGNGVANLLVFRSKASETLRLVERDDDDDDVEASLNRTTYST